MTHWSEDFIGRPYVRGAQDCVGLAVSVRREQFHHDPDLPLPERWSGLRHDPDMLLRDYGLPTDEPEDGDAVVMRCGRAWHVGIYCDMAEPYVLHATMNHGRAHLTRLRDLGRQGITIEGFYQWK